jgi:hypothetical protein
MGLSVIGTARRLVEYQSRQTLIPHLSSNNSAKIHQAHWTPNYYRCSFFVSCRCVIITNVVRIFLVVAASIFIVQCFFLL